MKKQIKEYCNHWIICSHANKCDRKITNCIRGSLKCETCEKYCGYTILENQKQLCFSCVEKVAIKKRQKSLIKWFNEALKKGDKDE